VSALQNEPVPAGVLARPASEGARWHLADPLLPASVALWAFGVSQTNAAALGPYGLPAALPVVFYAGAALLVASAAAELARSRPSPVRMMLHAVALVVVLYGTAPLLYPEGRYAWLYKTTGVVQYISAHGQLARHIDIYQNWPGFFAAAAWLDKVAGVASPLSYARWAQLVFELAALPLLYLIYRALALPPRQRWVALLLYSASNWIGQDYFSPQALGTLLSLGIMALALRWMGVWSPPGRSGSPRPDRPGAEQPGSPPSFCVLLVLLYVVLTFTHELSPYLVLVQLGALAVAGLLRPRWLPVALAVAAAGYLLPRFGYLNGRYGLVASIGDFFGNAAPPSAAEPAVPASQALIQDCAAALSLGIWALSLAGAWRRRRSGRAVLALVLLAYSPVLILAAGAYGNEGILRVYLFSLPWSAALAAAVLAPLPTDAPDGAAGVSAPAALRLRWPRRGALRAPLALGVALTLFFPAFFGDDRLNVMTEAEMTEVASFLQRARAGPVFCAQSNAPTADTARYDLFPMVPVLGAGGVLRGAPVRPGIAGLLARQAVSYTGGREPAYVLITPSMIAYGESYGIPASSFTTLLAALARSRSWRIAADRPGAVIYELPPGSVPRGPVWAGPRPGFTVP
jgi:hypothetical protein